MTSLSKIIHINKLADIVKEYNNTYHIAKSKWSLLIWAKTPIMVFMIEKVKNTVPWTCLISDLNGEEIVGSLFEKKL